MIIDLEALEGYISYDQFYEISRDLFRKKFYYSDLYFNLSIDDLDDFAAALDDPECAQPDKGYLYDKAFEDFWHWALEEYGHCWDKMPDAEQKLHELYLKRLIKQALDDVALAVISEPSEQRLLTVEDLDELHAAFPLPTEKPTLLERLKNHVANWWALLGN